ncbi:MAG: hypothetical protein KDA81_18345, partial [Planctomycetaceae bacterium]|nr:hypothetical protein [Planctomycetaceae bacterium]
MDVFSLLIPSAGQEGPINVDRSQLSTSGEFGSTDASSFFRTLQVIAGTSDKPGLARSVADSTRQYTKESGTVLKAIERPVLNQNRLFAQLLASHSAANQIPFGPELPASRTIDTLSDFAAETGTFHVSQQGSLFGDSEPANVDTSVLSVVSQAASTNAESESHPKASLGHSSIPALFATVDADRVEGGDATEARTSQLQFTQLTVLHQVVAPAKTVPSTATSLPDAKRGNLRQRNFADSETATGEPQPDITVAPNLALNNVVDTERTSITPQSPVSVISTLTAVVGSSVPSTFITDTTTGPISRLENSDPQSALVVSALPVTILNRSAVRTVSAPQDSRLPPLPEVSSVTTAGKPAAFNVIAPDFSVASIASADRSDVVQEYTPIRLDDQAFIHLRSLVLGIRDEPVVAAKQNVTPRPDFIAASTAPLKVADISPEPGDVVDSSPPDAHSNVVALQPAVRRDEPIPEFQSSIETTPVEAPHSVSGPVSSPSHHDEISPKELFHDVSSIPNSSREQTVDVTNVESSRKAVTDTPEILPGPQQVDSRPITDPSSTSERIP